MLDSEVNGNGVWTVAPASYAENSKEIRAFVRLSSSTPLSRPSHSQFHWSDGADPAYIIARAGLDHSSKPKSPLTIMCGRTVPERSERQ